MAELRTRIEIIVPPILGVISPIEALGVQRRLERRMAHITAGAFSRLQSQVPVRTGKLRGRLYRFEASGGVPGRVAYEIGARLFYASFQDERGPNAGWYSSVTADLRQRAALVYQQTVAETVGQIERTSARREEQQTARAARLTFIAAARQNRQKERQQEEDRRRRNRRLNAFVHIYVVADFISGPTLKNPFRNLKKGVARQDNNFGFTIGADQVDFVAAYVGRRAAAKAPKGGAWHRSPYTGKRYYIPHAHAEAFAANRRYSRSAHRALSADRLSDMAGMGARAVQEATKELVRQFGHRGKISNVAVRPWSIRPSKYARDTVRMRVSYDFTPNPGIFDD